VSLKTVAKAGIKVINSCTRAAFNAASERHVMLLAGRPLRSRLFPGLDQLGDGIEGRELVDLRDDPLPGAHIRRQVFLLEPLDLFPCS
jgi:hypothetical protein